MEQTRQPHTACDLKWEETAALSIFWDFDAAVQTKLNNDRGGMSSLLDEISHTKCKDNCLLER